MTPTQPENDSPTHLPGLRCVCLSLPSRTDRQFVFERVYPYYLGGELEFFPAVDGSIIPQWKIDRLKARHGLEELRGSNWAVRMSKLMILREFIRSDDDYLLFMEDDCLFRPEFEQDWQTALRDMPEEWDVIMFGVGENLEETNPGTLQRLKESADNQCLLFSKAGARKARKFLRQVTSNYSDRELQRAMARGELDAWWLGRTSVAQRASSSDNSDDRSSLRCCPAMMAGDDDQWLLAAAVNAGDTVLEWGSGGSTLLLANSAGESGYVYSFEHNSHYAERTRIMLQMAHLEGRVVLTLIPPRPERSQDGPWRYYPGQMKEYVATPARMIPAGSVDVAFVDGRERMTCAQEALNLLKPGGFLLIHDFWGRQRYRTRIQEILTRADLIASTPTKDVDGIATDMVLFQKR